MEKSDFTSCIFSRSEIFSLFASLGRCWFFFVCCSVLREFLCALPWFSHDLGFGLHATFFCPVSVLLCASLLAAGVFVFRTERTDRAQFFPSDFRRASASRSGLIFPLADPFSCSRCGANFSSRARSAPRAGLAFDFRSQLDFPVTGLPPGSVFFCPFSVGAVSGAWFVLLLL
jgi:hypothetical protein